MHRMKKVGLAAMPLEQVGGVQQIETPLFVTGCSKASSPRWILRAAACDQGGKHQCSGFVSTFARKYQLCGHQGFRYTAYFIELREPSKDCVSSFQQGLPARHSSGHHF
jgi:hypothetical protein